MSSSSVFSMEERVLESFASLLSAAVKVSGDGFEVIGDSATAITRFISDTVARDATCCVAPALRIKASKSSSMSSSNGKSTTCSIEEAATANLAHPVAFTRDELENAPIILLEDISESFMCLVDSRLRASLAALVRQSRHQTDPTLTRIVVGLLASSTRAISPTAIVTSFRVLPVSDNNKNNKNNKTSVVVVLPMVAETVVDLNILGTLISVTMVAPGTIQGIYHATTTTGEHQSSNDVTLLAKVELTLDTNDLLKSMMNQARLVVRKAVEIGTGIATNLLITSSLLAAENTSSESQTTPNNAPSSSSSNDQVPLPQQVESKENGGQHEQQDTTRMTFDDQFSMPPPPRRKPSRRSIGDLRPLHHHDQEEEHHDSLHTNGFSNATWPAPPQGHVSQQQQQEHQDSSSAGLCLLTAAAEGMKHPRPDMLHRSTTASEEPLRIRRKISSG